MNSCKLFALAVALALLLSAPRFCVGDAIVTPTNTNPYGSTTLGSGSCSSCTPVNADRTCEGSGSAFPNILCVDNSKGDTTNLPCLNLGAGTAAAGKQCPADMPTKMCCGNQSFGNSNTQSNTNTNSNTAQSSSSTSSKHTSAAATTSGSIVAMVIGAAGAFLLLQLL